MLEESVRQQLVLTLPPKIEAHLDALTPRTEPWAIARALRNRGIKGRREKGCDCPLAHYVCEVLPAGMLAHVDGNYVEVYSDVPNYLGIGMEPPLCRVKLPEHFTDFVCEFDAGRYPSLIDLEA